jgi:fumarylacetoacetase
MTSTWIEVPDGTDFPLTNLPYGVFSAGAGERRVGVAIGDHVLDVASVLDLEVLQGPSLDPLLTSGPPTWRDVRARLEDVVTSDKARARVEPHLHPLDVVQLHLPFTVADYVDFYSSRDHAENLGRIFRPDGDALTPNWLHLPIGYHGRAGSVVVSGTDVLRPTGQTRPDRSAPPVWGPTVKLDVEVEVGFVVGAPSVPGVPVPTGEVDEHVFGALLVNDWSARDIQSWEYQPLGPMLGKSFATTVSPWVVPMAALAEARVAAPEQDPAPLPYLQPPGWGLDVELSLDLNGQVLSRPQLRGVYWTVAQQLAHLTSNGAAVRAGDLLATGTVSGPERDRRGSLIELTEDGASPVELDDGQRRGYLEDGDTVVIRGSAPGLDGTRIGFGDARGTVCPAKY